MSKDCLHPICQQILNFCQQAEIVNKTLTVAYSGGVDSQVLLHAVAQLSKANLLAVTVNAIHINHGLSVNAANWSLFCQQQAEQLSIPFQAVAVVIDQQSPQSLEALARDARYKALQQTCVNHSVILTGHHVHDQVETFLLALKRGAGIQGLSAMQELRTLNNTQPEQHKLLARPLLNVSREDIESYASMHDLQWIEDESNSDQRFDRNFIRAEVLPLLKQRWPAINQTIARSANHCEQAQNLLEQLAAVDLRQCQLSPDSLSITEMSSLPEDRINNLLRHFIKVNGGLMPSTQQLEQVYNACFVASVDKNPHISLTDYSLRRFNNALFFTRNYADISQWQKSLALQKITNETIDLPDGLGQLQLQRITRLSDFKITKQDSNNFACVIAISADMQQLSIKFQHNNPKCWPDYRAQRRPLKKVLQEQGVATWLRNRLPFIFVENDLAAVLPLFVCREFVAKEFIDSKLSNTEQNLDAIDNINVETHVYLKITWLNI